MPDLDDFDRRLLAALQDERAVAQVVPFVTAFQYILFGQAVPGNVTVRLADAAIEAVIAANIREFNNAAEKDFLAENLQGQAAGQAGVTPASPIPSMT